VGILPRETFSPHTFADAVHSTYTPAFVENAKRRGEIERRDYSDSRPAVEAIATIVKTPIAN
jgi:hypothetical protein